MSETRTPVQYTVVEKSLIDNRIAEAGDVVEYAGLPAENLKPMCEEGEARYQEYLESNKARQAKQLADNAPAGDLDAFFTKFRAELAASQASMAETIATAVAAAVASAMNKPAAKAKPAAHSTETPPADLA